MSDGFLKAGDLLSNGVLRAINGVLRPLPYRLRVNTGGAVGRLLFPLFPGASKRVYDNLRRVYPDLPLRQRKAFLGAVAENFGRVMVEEGSMAQFAADPSRFHPTGPGWEAFQTAVAEGKGPIIATAHYANWEGIRVIAKGLGMPLPIVYRPHNNPFYNADFVAGLEVLSPMNFPKGTEGTRQMLAHTRKGGGVVILIDQKQTGAPLLPFLGFPAETTLTAAKLAKGEQHPFFPAICRRRADGVSFDVIFGVPIPEGTAEERMTAANYALSAWIEEVSHQWFWFHRRWR